MVSVRVDHSHFADSRWYTGSGIYRHVLLRATSPLHIATWGTSVTTPKVSPSSAQVRIETAVVNEGAKSVAYSVQSDVLDAGGRTVASRTSGGSLAAGGSAPTVEEIRVTRPALWSLDSPVRYALRSRVLVGGVLQDDTMTPRAC